MRVALQGSEDVVVLNDVNGSWITDDCEPVEVSFAWQQPTAAPLNEEDFICSPELAARLMDMLNNCEQAEKHSKKLAMAIPAVPVV